MTMQTSPSNSSTPTRAPAVNGEAVIDLAAIAHNVRVLREHAGSAQVMAVPTMCVCCGNTPGRHR